MRETVFGVFTYKLLMDMARIVINTAPVDVSEERMRRHLAKTPGERFRDLLRLNMFTKRLSGGRSIRSPQGKGIIIRKKNPSKD
jgi:hypothetical protein